MKFKSILIASAAALTVLCGCQKDNSTTEEVKISVTPASFDLEAKADTKTVSLTSNAAWQLSGYTAEVQSWISVSPASGSASDAAQTITIKVLENTGADRNASITFYADKAHQATVTIKQKGAKGDVESISVKEFLEKKDTQTEYSLSGKIGSISNSSSYWGFYLNDGTGELCCPFVEDWEDYAGELHTGDQVTIKGAYDYYESKSQDQLANGTILEWTPASKSEIKTLTVADFLSKADSYTRYRLSGEVASSVNATYCSFDLKDETGTVKVWTVNNASEWGSKVKQGGTVTLVGAYTLYTSGSTSTPEVVDADVESFDEGDPAGEAETSGLVVAVSSQSFIVQEESGDYTYVYAAKDPGVKVGDKVEVKGEESEYAGLAQIANPTTTVISGDNPVTYPTPNSLDGAGVDAYPATPGFGYVSVTGDLTKSGNYYNLKISGATRTGSLAYPVDVDGFVGKTVDVTGFFVGITGSIYFNILVVGIKESENQSEIPTLTHPVESSVAWTLGSSAYDNTSSGSSAQSATVNKQAVSNLLKLGASKNGGDATLTIPEGKTKIGFYAVGWKLTQSEISGGLEAGSKVALTVGDKTVDVSRNDGATGNPPYTLTLSDEVNYYEVDVTPGSVKISTPAGAGNRIAIIGITAY